VLVRAGDFDAQNSEASNYIAMRFVTSSGALWCTARRTHSQPHPRKNATASDDAIFQLIHRAAIPVVIPNAQSAEGSAVS
jgi:hypothetical protein